MPTQFRSLPGVYVGQSSNPRNIFTSYVRPVAVPTAYTIDGTLSRDPDNTGSTSVLRAGLLMGVVTTSKKFANSILGLTTAALGDAQTTLTATSQAVTELVRRVGASGTFTLTGPPTPGGTARSLTVTYSAASGTSITITPTGTGAVSGVNAVEANPFVDSTGSGTYTLTIEGVTTGPITYSSTAATLVSNENTALNAAFGTSAIVASGSSLANHILTFSGTGYTNRPIGNSSNGTVSGVKVITTLLTGATGFTAGNNPTSSGIGALLAGGSTTTTAGVVPVTGTGGEFVLGSLIQPTDGSQIALTPLVNEYGVDVTDTSGNSIDQRLDYYYTTGDFIAGNLINLTTGDAGCQTFLKTQLRATGNAYTFNNDR